MNESILIAAGGTGGHAYPAISIAKALKEKGYRPFFVVKKQDRCIPLLEKENMEYYELNVSGFPRGVTFGLIAFIFRMFLAFWSSFRIIRDIKPAVVVGLGNYLSFPVITSSRLMGIPAVIHEQNYLPGLANRILSKYATSVMVSFPESKKYFSAERTVFTGNIIRKEITGITEKNGCETLGITKDRVSALVFGGSQGAHFINKLMVESLPFLEKIKDKIQFVHITGEKDFSWVKSEYNKMNFKSKVLPYLHEIGAAYAVADFVVCRSGATTLAEVIALEKPAVFIPFARATENHQKLNADYLGRAGAALVYEEKELDSEKFVSLLRGLAENPEKTHSLKKAFSRITAFRSLEPEKTILDTVTNLVR